MNPHDNIKKSQIMIFCYVKKIKRYWEDLHGMHDIDQLTSQQRYHDTLHILHTSVYFFYVTERKGRRDTNKLTYVFFFEKLLNF